LAILPAVISRILTAGIFNRRNLLVVHCKKQLFNVYIGRPSKWGNPFTIGRDGDREQVIKKYEHWVLSQPILIQQIKKELKGKILGCWCKPKPCHGDILNRIANE
jgi:hypothetical protein